MALIYNSTKINLDILSLSIINIYGSLEALYNIYNVFNISYILEKYVFYTLRLSLQFFSYNVIYIIA